MGTDTLKPGTGNILQLMDEGGSSALRIAINGDVSLENDLLETSSNQFPYIKGAELNSLGLLKKVIFGFYANLTDTKLVPNASDTEIDGTWTEITDPFGKFASGRWTPTIDGYYLCGGTLNCPGIDDGELLAVTLSKNGLTTAGNYTQQLGFASGTDQQQCGNVSAVFYLDTDDCFSLFAYQNSGADQTISPGVSTIFAAYLGSSSI
tara:strand:- start:104 stop:724 length:621 start_codon:yes stop_codon:yes gene_type:complete